MCVLAGWQSYDTLDAYEQAVARAEWEKPVLARDRDFEVLAAVSALRLHVAPGGA